MGQKQILWSHCLPVYDGATEPIYPKSSNQIVRKPGQLATNGSHKYMRGGWEGGGAVFAHVVRSEVKKRTGYS